MRVKLARNAPRQVRLILIRDSNSMVAMTVLTANSLPESEVEQIANSRAVCEEVLLGHSQEQGVDRQIQHRQGADQEPRRST